MLVFACSDGESRLDGPEVTHVHPENGPTHDHGDGSHAGHDGMADHMAVMSATRDRLRSELGDAYDLPVPGLEQADADRGKALYEQNCATCHGVTGKGDGPASTALDPKPADFTDAFHARYYSDAGRVRLIAQGSPGTAMPAFGGTLEEKQILDVYAFVRSLR